MRELLELTKEFKTSRPVFLLRKSNRDDMVTTELNYPVYRYRPVADESNILSVLVVSHFSEDFKLHKGEFVIDKKDIATKAMYEIRSCMCKFLEKNLKMRNARQSKIYRWYYRNMPSNDAFNDVLVMVYKYMRSFSDSDMIANDINNLNNAIALLGAIMEKHDD